MVSSDATTPDAYLASCPRRRRALTALRDVILTNLPAGYEEGMQYGMIGYFVPLERFPKRTTASRSVWLASPARSGTCSLYLATVYGDPETDRWFRERYAASGRSSTWARVCALPPARRSAARSHRRDDRSVPVDQYVERYRAVRGSIAQGTGHRKLIRRTRPGRGPVASHVAGYGHQHVARRSRPRAAPR
jgi:hypothetical protein